MNPENFANLFNFLEDILAKDFSPAEEVQKIASKGGQASHGPEEGISPTSSPNPGNFQNRPTKEVREIAAKGGATSHGHSNPTNFGNRSKEEVQEIAAEGGHASHVGGFASMDPERQQETASEGGKASSGSFEPGSEKAREVDRKGGLASGSA
ncbi:conidiation-specific protein 10 [Colletotrichum spaethianum]|uniref:Conidiation-specific protein 10 n=1 Tax=Colletotrichum spaethianum TaxID=700344 RepID=A0AA37L195_9PEZI|nr:conidiation-specific protein 10 [Colletotrichum spaethianum]GKT39841.1 conidiation-specific protein 10 [Colletotrichum spaethianum]